MREADVWYISTTTIAVARSHQEIDPQDQLLGLVERGVMAPVETTHETSSFCSATTIYAVVLN